MVCVCVCGVVYGVGSVYGVCVCVCVCGVVYGVGSVYGVCVCMWCGVWCR